MKNIFWGLIILAIAGAAMVWGLEAWTRSSADLEYQRAAGQALVIEAQGQARLDAAQASAITSAAMLPWAVVFCASVLSTVAVVFLLRTPTGRPQPPQIIERQVVILPPAADYSRRELLAILSQAQAQQARGTRFLGAESAEIGRKF
jgi:hypothetical protein